MTVLIIKFSLSALATERSHTHRDSLSHHRHRSFISRCLYYSLHPNARQAYLSDWLSSLFAPPSLTASQNSGEALTSAACGAMRRVRFVLRQGWSWSWAVRCHVRTALYTFGHGCQWVWAGDGRVRVRRRRTSILRVHSTSLSHQASAAFYRLQTRDSSHFPNPYTSHAR